jgi:hypothetical protein
MPPEQPEAHHRKAIGSEAGTPTISIVASALAQREAAK